MSSGNCSRVGEKLLKITKQNVNGKRSKRRSYQPGGEMNQQNKMKQKVSSTISRNPQTGPRQVGPFSIRDSPVHPPAHCLAHRGERLPVLRRVPNLPQVPCEPLSDAACLYSKGDLGCPELTTSSLLPGEGQPDCHLSHL